MSNNIYLLLESLENTPPSNSLHDAWHAINNTLADLPIRNHEGKKWSLPSIDSPSTHDYGDGGKAFRLISHILYINKNGAFRINKIEDKLINIFEKESSDGKNFSEVRDYIMPIHRRNS